LGQAEVLRQSLRHLFRPRPSDRPDVSIGLCWGNERRRRGLPPVDRVAPLWLPDQDREAELHVYDNPEWGDFTTWFNSTYLPEKLPLYLGNKKEFKAHGPLPPASAADHTCLGITGHPAHLNHRIRRQLTAIGGFAPVGTKPSAIEGSQGDLFDCLR
jgi:hypothetical protein